MLGAGQRPASTRMDRANAFSCRCYIRATLGYIHPGRGFTFTGILSHFSGFMPVDPDEGPTGSWFNAGRIDVVKRAPNWCFLASP
jgi:hypothetical protein